MNDRPMTITDIARELGVSATTVHKVIYHKKGVGPETRERILDYIHTHNFQLNRAASALKRRRIRLGYVGVEPTVTDRNFYESLRAGVEEACSNQQSFYVSLQTFTSQDNVESQLALLEQIYRDHLQELDGLVLTCLHEELLSPMIDKFTAAGVPVVTLFSDAANSSRGAHICSNGLVAGRTVADLMDSYNLPPRSQLLLIGGFRHYSNHSLSSQGFLSRMKELRPDLEIMELYRMENEQISDLKIRKILESSADIRGIYCVTSKGTKTLCRTLRDMGLSGKIRLIGTDVSPELRPYFADRTISAAIFQDPKRQGARAVFNLYNLIMAEQPPAQVELVNVSIVVCSNLDCYLEQPPQ